jgi:hypothetical protein
VTCFEFVYGVPPDQNGGPFINGDDVVALRLNATGTITDVYGVISVDGSGTIWEYLDSWARRNSSVTSATATFSSAEWTYGGANALDGATPAEIAALSYRAARGYGHTGAVRRGLLARSERAPVRHLPAAGEEPRARRGV